MHRMVSAALALGGFFLALYLWLWKIGFIGGAIACGTGACEAVQLSEYAHFLGQPVAFYGVGGYIALFGVSMWGLHGRWAARREPTLVLVALAGIGVVFTAYLSYLEAFVIGAWCRWCLVSAAIIFGNLAVAVTGLVRMRDQPTG